MTRSTETVRPRDRSDRVIFIASDGTRQRLERMDRRRTVSITLLAVVSIANAIALGAMIGSLITGRERSGGELLFKAVVIWATNVTVFGLWFWALDRGGPSRRIQPDPPPPDFQFPQMENPKLAQPGRYPQLEEYIYVSIHQRVCIHAPPTRCHSSTQPNNSCIIENQPSHSSPSYSVAGRAVNILH